MFENPGDLKRCLSGQVTGGDKRSEVGVVFNCNFNIYRTDTETAVTWTLGQDLQPWQPTIRWTR